MNEIKNIPGHIAIIMDGNRRWAKQRKLDAKLGHKKEQKLLKILLNIAIKLV